ncbi:MAG TPA: VOC family protein [Gemmatimonadales bacterium]|nr:VOC family protein [Gemmatimonadales bacterium]
MELAQVTNVVHDIDRAVIFHRDTLGLPLLFQAPPSLAFFQLGTTRLMLSPPENAEQDHPGSVLYFKVQDIERVHRTLAGKGVQFVDKPHRVHHTAEHELWMTFFHDPDNNPMALMEEKRKA